MRSLTGFGKRSQQSPYSRHPARLNSESNGIKIVNRSLLNTATIFFLEETHA
jgi:hypothetical protein